MAILGFRAAAGMVLVGALFSSTSNAQQACDRACLTQVVDGYFAALVANDAAKLPQAAKARITENGAAKKLAQTFWDSAAEVVYRWDIVNTVQELTTKRREIDERRMAAGLPPQYGNDPKKGGLV